MYDKVGLVLPSALKHCWCANREFSGAIASVISMLYQSNDAVKFWSLPGCCRTRPKVNVLPTSGFTFVLPWRSSISSGKKGLPGRANPFGPAAPRSNTDLPSFEASPSLLLMIARHSAWTATRFGFEAKLPQGAVVVNEHGSLGAKGTTSNDTPWNNSAVFGARSARCKPPRSVKLSNALNVNKPFHVSVVPIWESG